MNEHYTSNLNLSSASSRKSSASLADSLEDITSSNDTCDILKQTLKAGDYCAAQFSHSWVRCRIIDIKGSNKTAFIECVDDGRTQRTSLNKLQTLREDFRNLQKLALKCKLSQLNNSVKLISLSIKAVDSFKKFISEGDREFTAQIVKFRNRNDEGNEENQIFEVELFYEGTNIIQMLTKQ